MRFGIGVEETIRPIRRVQVQMAVSRMRERARKFGLNQMSVKDIENEIRAVRRARQRQP